MSRREDSPKLGLGLNLSPPRVNTPVESPNVSTSSSSSDMSVEGSCVSSEPEESTVYSARNHLEASMMLGSCPRCLMYVMSSHVEPKCPKCKSTVLLDFLKEENTNTNKTRN